MADLAFQSGSRERDITLVVFGASARISPDKGNEVVRHYLGHDRVAPHAGVGCRKIAVVDQLVEQQPRLDPLLMGVGRSRIDDPEGRNVFTECDDELSQPVVAEFYESPVEPRRLAKDV